MFSPSEVFMRPASVIAVSTLFLAQIARAACPGPDCFAGGGPAATDCIVTWSGITAPSTTCVDGSSCDQDGVADGMCTFPLAACLGDASCGVTGGVTSVKVTPARMAGGAALQAAIQALAPDRCTTPGFAVPVKLSAQLGPIKPGVDRMRALVAAGGKKDPDAIKLTCQAASPSFAADIQPILTQRCTQGACHSADFASESLNLSEGAAYGALVGPKAIEGGKLKIVTPRSISKSFMARKILGRGLNVSSGAMMPQGCPGVPPAGGCLTAAEQYLILSWIQAGAPNN
jgi:hypothetical protein